MKAPDTFGSLLAVGITTLIGVQVIINIAVVTGLIPVTGMALPFFSAGGTALMILLASMGILLNISKKKKKEHAKKYKDRYKTGKIRTRLKITNISSNILKIIANKSKK